MFAVGQLAPWVLTMRLASTLARQSSAGVVWLSSQSHQSARLAADDIVATENESADAAYARTKLANVTTALALSQRWSGTSVQSLAFDPGPTETPLMATLRAQNGGVKGWLLRSVVPLFSRAAEVVAADLSWAVAAQGAGERVQAALPEPVRELLLVAASYVGRGAVLPDGRLAGAEGSRHGVAATPRGLPEMQAPDVGQHGADSGDAFRAARGSRHRARHRRLPPQPPRGGRLHVGHPRHRHLSGRGERRPLAQTQLRHPERSRQSVRRAPDDGRPYHPKAEEERPRVPHRVLRHRSHWRRWPFV